MKVNGKYRLLQGCYWMQFCVGYGYVTVFLLDWGYTAGSIGIITAVFGTLAAVLQPLLGRLADRGGRFGWRPLLTALAAASLAVAAGLFLCRQKVVIGILYGCFLTLISSGMPLVNAASFYYQNRGETVDFGIARGLGSLSFAVLSLALGQLTASLGTGAVSVAGVFISALFLAVIVWMPYPFAENIAAPQEKAAGEKTRAAAGRGGFFRRYPSFTWVLFGTVLLLAFHNITNTYLIHMLERVGGDSGDLGVAMAIAAVSELPVMFSFSRIVKKRPAILLLLVSGFAFILKGIVFLCAASVFVIDVAQLLQMLSYALFTPASVYYAEQSMAPEDKVSGQAWITCTVTIGAVVGNLLGGWALELWGIGVMLQIAVVLAVFGTAMVAVPAGLRRRKLH